MPHSTTEFRERGFWTSDGPLQTALALLVVELDPMSADDPHLDRALDHWCLQAVIAFRGCVSANFDNHPKDLRMCERVADALSRLAGRLPESGIVQADNGVIAARAERLAPPTSWRNPHAAVDWVREVVVALGELALGTFPEAPDDSYWSVTDRGRNAVSERSLDLKG